jgi:sulfate transport system permease protein
MTMRASLLRSPSPLPGFGLSFGIMMAILSIVVLLPIGALLGRGLMIGPADVWGMVNSRRIWAALELSFRAALIASLFNLVFGLALAWVLVRYRFWGAS